LFSSLILLYYLYKPPTTMTMMATTTSSTAGTSSLARASQVGSHTGVQPRRLETRSGAFEACFAGGLDLSEFGNNTSTPPTSNTSINNSFDFNTTATISASAALLQVKAQESLERHREEQEEFRMQAIAQKRAQSLHESATMNNNGDNEDDEKVLWAAPPKDSYGTSSDKFDNNNAKTENSMLGALVGSMHGGDELNVTKASRTKMKKDKRSQSVAKKDSKVNKQAKVQSSKGRSVAKKSKRSKY
jgi:hypothetical protein